MLGIYMLAAILGGGWFLFSLLLGGDHDATGMDASGFHVGHDFDVGHHLDAGHDIAATQAVPGQLLLGLFRPRNVIFFFTAFGLTGSLLTWTGTSESTTLFLALAMGAGAMVLTHSVFTWLRRSESAVEALSDMEMEGRVARVVLPLAPGESGRVACMVADREIYLNARLAADTPGSLEPGREVVIVRVQDGIAEVTPFDTTELASSEDDVPELPSPES